MFERLKSMFALNSGFCSMKRLLICCYSSLDGMQEHRKVAISLLGYDPWYPFLHVGPVVQKPVNANLGLKVN